MKSVYLGSIIISISFKANILLCFPGWDHTLGSSDPPAAALRSWENVSCCYAWIDTSEAETRKEANGLFKATNPFSK